MNKLFEKIDGLDNFTSINEDVSVHSITDIQSEIYEMIANGKEEGQSKEDNVQATYEEIFNNYTTEELVNETFENEAELRKYIETKANEMYEAEMVEEETLNEVGDTKDYSEQIEKLFKKWFKENADLGIRATQWLTSSYDLNIKMREVGEGETRKYQYRVSNWSPLVDVEDWADEIGNYIADNISALEYKGAKTLDKAQDNGEDYEQTIWYFDQQIGIKDFGDHIFDSEKLTEDEFTDQENEIMAKFAEELSNVFDQPIYWVTEYNQFEFDETRDYIDVAQFCEEYQDHVEMALARLSSDDRIFTLSILGRFGFELDESEDIRLDEDAENILTDEDEAEINSIIDKIRELNGTIKHTVVDEVISINARIEALNKKLKYSVEELEDETVYLNTADVISDLEYLIKESNWAKEDAEEVNESEELVEENVMQPGDKFVNQNGAVIVITDPTNNGTPQWNVAPSQSDYDAGKFVCLGTDSYETLERILSNNGYDKVENNINESEKDYSDLELKIADEILYEMAKKGLDSTDILEVHKFLEEFASQEIINYMDSTGEELIWYIEDDPTTTFKVIVTTV